MVKGHKVEKKKKEGDKKKWFTTNISILISSVLIVLCALVYRFEVAGQTFYLRYIILFLALMILFDSLSNEFAKQEGLVKAFQTIKILTGVIIVFIMFVLIYYVMTLPST